MASIAPDAYVFISDQRRCTLMAVILFANTKSSVFTTQTIRINGYWSPCYNIISCGLTSTSRNHCHWTRSADVCHHRPTSSMLVISRSLEFYIGLSTEIVLCPTTRRVARSILIHRMLRMPMSHRYWIFAASSRWCKSVQSLLVGIGFGSGTRRHELYN